MPGVIETVTVSASDNDTENPRLFGYAVRFEGLYAIAELTCRVVIDFLRVNRYCSVIGGHERWFSIREDLGSCIQSHHKAGCNCVESQSFFNVDSIDNAGMRL